METPADEKLRAVSDLIRKFEENPPKVHSLQERQISRPYRNLIDELKPIVQTP
jgi:hypothetical protein